MSEIRCKNCGALLKNKDVKNGECWKCNEPVIIVKEPETTQHDSPRPSVDKQNQSSITEQASERFTVPEIIKNSFYLGIKHYALFIPAFILWILTCWIPYFNVGITIGLIGIIASVSKGTPVSVQDIFDAKYRKNMGEFFLLLSFIGGGIVIGYALVIVPGIVITIAWSQAVLLFADKNYTALDSIKKSNDMTHGHKMTIFLSAILLLLLFFGYGLLVFLITYLFGFLSFGYGGFSSFVGFLFYLAIFTVPVLVKMGWVTYLYRELSKK